MGEQRALAVFAPGRENSCDTFICLYVFELLPSVEDVKRILRIAERMLVPGGVAFVQTKYHTADWRPRAYKRDYAHNLSTMTSFGIDEFWSLAKDPAVRSRGDADRSWCPEAGPGGGAELEVGGLGVVNGVEPS